MIAGAATHLRSALLLPAAVELDPDGPVVAEDTEVVPLVEMDLAAGPHHSHPGTAVQSDTEITLIYSLYSYNMLHHGTDTPCAAKCPTNFTLILMVILCEGN